MHFEIGSIAIDNAQQIYAILNNVPEDAAEPTRESLVVRRSGDEWHILRRFTDCVLRDIAVLTNGTIGVIDADRRLYVSAHDEWRDFQLLGDHNQSPSRFAHDREHLVVVGGRRIWTFQANEISTRDLPRRHHLSGGCRYRNGWLGCGEEGVIAYIPASGEIELFRPPHKDNEQLVDIDCCGDAWWGVSLPPKVFRGQGREWEISATLDRETTYLTSVIALDAAWAIASGNGLFDLRFDGVRQLSPQPVHAIACTSDHQHFVAATAAAILRGPDWQPISAPILFP